MVASANFSETPVSGKYGRVFVSTDGTNLYPVNLSQWSIDFKTENEDTSGFEAAGFEEGIATLIGATLNLEGPYQVNRTGGLAAPGMQILIPARWIYYQLFLAHPDYQSTLGSLLRYAGVAQVLTAPTEQNVRRKANITVTCASRGPIYRPGVSESLSGPQQIALYSTGILS